MLGDKLLTLLLLGNLMLRDYGKGFIFWLWLFVFVIQVIRLFFAYEIKLIIGDPRDPRDPRDIGDL